MANHPNRSRRGETTSELFRRKSERLRIWVNEPTSHEPSGRLHTNVWLQYGYSPAMTAYGDDDRFASGEGADPALVGRLVHVRIWHNAGEDVTARVSRAAADIQSEWLDIAPNLTVSQWTRRFVDLV